MWFFCNFSTANSAAIFWTFTTWLMGARQYFLDDYQLVRFYSKAIRTHSNVCSPIETMLC